MAIQDPRPFYGAYDHYVYPHRYWPNPPSKVCPGCGRCNTCGRVAPDAARAPKIVWGTTTLQASANQS